MKCNKVRIERILKKLRTDEDANASEIKQSEKYRLIIARTLLKLPTSVRNKVLKNVCFMLPNDCLDSLGYCIDLYYKPTLINIQFNKMKDYPRAFKESVISHEIAHFILRDTKHHKIFDKMTSLYKTKKEREKEEEIRKKCEDKVDELVKEWGFIPNPYDTLPSKPKK